LGCWGHTNALEGSIQSHHCFAIKLGRNGKEDQRYSMPSGEMRPGGTPQLLEMLEESDHKELCCYVLRRAVCWLRRDGEGKAGFTSSLMKLSVKQ